ncbi:hypothetical protein GCM10023172_31320 [Hymenobacter ginsengisoli]|uniref:Uncharacterized protein n=2 Tax=Hymenobacteraceae TaxID=1853232 RepID=A0ABP8QKK4_9BACT
MGVILLFSFAPPLGFAVLISGPVVALVASFFPRFSEWLFWQPMSVWLSSDGVAWLKPGAGQPEKYLFAELRAYRFRVGKSVTDILLWPVASDEDKIRCRYSVEFASFQQAFIQAIKAYNQLNPSAQVTVVEEPMVRFFKSPASTNVLFGLLMVLALWVGWGVARGRHPAVYIVPTLLLLLPYLLIWANFYYQRR